LTQFFFSHFLIKLFFHIHPSTLDSLIIELHDIIQFAFNELYFFYTLIIFLLIYLSSLYFLFILFKLNKFIKSSRINNMIVINFL
jgi:hypothetical protein